MSSGPKGRFRSVRGVRAFVSRVLRGLEENTGAGDVEAARCKLYGAKIMAELISSSVLEDRIIALEVALRRQKNEAAEDVDRAN